MDATFNHALDTIEKSVPIQEQGVHFYLQYPRRTMAEVKIMLESYRCNCCTNRTFQFHPLYSVGGKPCLLNGIKNTDAVMKEIRAATLVCKSSARQDPELFLVCNDTFPPFVDYKAFGVRTDYRHFTVLPSTYTDDSVVAKFSPLWEEYKSILDSRITKFREAGSMVMDALKNAARGSHFQEHFLPTILWMEGISCHLGQVPFGMLSHEERMKVRVYALMTGCSQGKVHFDYKKSEMILDMLTMPNVSAMTTAMNERRDESNYMRSNVTKALAEHNITSPFTVSLAWDDPADLDLWVMSPGGNWAWYPQKGKNVDGMKLDLDANAGTNCEKNPVENVSIITPMAGEYAVYVNNYNSKGMAHDIPFQLLIKKKGMDDTIIDGVWNKKRGQNMDNIRQALLMTRIRFDDTMSRPVEMSEKMAKQVVANADEFEKMFGTHPSAEVADVASLPDFAFLTLAKRGSSASPASAASAVSVVGRRPSGSVSPLDMVKSMASMTLKSGTIPSSFPSMDDMFSFVKSNSCTLSIRVDQVSPGFFVDVVSNGKKIPVVRNPVPVHYQTIGHVPMEPRSRGNARGGAEGEWFPGKGHLDFVDVTGFVRMRPGHTTPYYFVTLKDAKLPATNSINFPLMGASGMYPTYLSSEAHKHRATFAAVGANVSPSMYNDTKRLVGGFLFGVDEVFLIDGQRVVVSSPP